jgi:L-threonylcarbamoyladenylate synthase
MALLLQAQDDNRARSALEIAARTILSGGIVAYATDTLYGLAVDPRNEAAVQRLFSVKGRVADRALPLIAATLDQVRALAVEMPPLAERLAAVFWPGPLTLLLPARPDAVPAARAGLPTVAVRIPDHPIAVGLASRCGWPITSTSANRSGRESALTAADVVSMLGRDIDLVLDAGPAPGGPASTIVDVTGAVPRLVRAGAVAWERVLESLG